MVTHAKYACSYASTGKGIVTKNLEEEGNTCKKVAKHDILTRKFKWEKWLVSGKTLSKSNMANSPNGLLWNGKIIYSQCYSENHDSCTPKLVFLN